MFPSNRTLCGFICLFVGWFVFVVLVAIVLTLGSASNDYGKLLYDSGKFLVTLLFFALI